MNACVGPATRARPSGESLRKSSLRGTLKSAGALRASDADHRAIAPRNALKPSEIAGSRNHAAWFVDQPSGVH